MSCAKMYKHALIQKTFSKGMSNGHLGFSFYNGVPRMSIVHVATHSFICYMCVSDLIWSLFNIFDIFLSTGKLNVSEVAPVGNKGSWFLVFYYIFHVCADLIDPGFLNLSYKWYCFKKYITCDLNTDLLIYISFVKSFKQFKVFCRAEMFLMAFKMIEGTCTWCNYLLTLHI